MKEKKLYIGAEVEIANFSTSDIIVTSQESGKYVDPDESSWDNT